MTDTTEYSYLSDVEMLRLVLCKHPPATGVELSLALRLEAVSDALDRVQRYSDRDALDD